ncbi:SMI1/KNR4 family protein [Methylobacterium aquaticum]|uniref:SMI1/KNR4 family protein n=1 Tax=Methylobacterium aquaticum TaxID=270351 RepID=UPI003D16DC92
MSAEWIDYLDFAFPRPTGDDRRRIEETVGHRLPDAYWHDVETHQGHTRRPDRIVLDNGRPERLGVYLYVVQPDRVEDEEARSYDLVSAFEDIRAAYPPGLVPFSDDTGGNRFAFDYRGGGKPGIVFVDHNVEGEAGVTPAAPDYETLIARLSGEA